MPDNTERTEQPSAADREAAKAALESIIRDRKIAEFAEIPEAGIIAEIAKDPETLRVFLYGQAGLAITSAAYNLVSQERERREKAERRAAKKEGREPVKIDFVTVFNELTEKPLFTPEQAREIIDRHTQKIIAALQSIGKADEAEQIIADYICKQEAEQPEDLRPLIGDSDEPLKRVKYNKTADVTSPTDKWAEMFFALTAPPPTGRFRNKQIQGQRSFAQLPSPGISVDYRSKAAKRKGKETNLLYDYSYNEEIIKKYGLEKSFTDYDFFVSIFLDNLKDTGNVLVSTTKIWHEMGNKGNPSPEQINELENSLLKGLSTIICVDVLQVLDTYHKPNEAISRPIITPVMPIQFSPDPAAIHGKVSNSLVAINGYSPFRIVAQALDRLTTWDKQVFSLYEGRRTKRYFGVLGYLLRQIGWMRHPKSKRNEIITYSAVYARLGDNTHRARQLTREMLDRLLEEVFEPLGYVTKYEETNSTTGEPGIKLTVPKERKLLQENSDVVNTK